MNFHPPLISGRLIQRYKRFRADIELDDGSVITAHVPNPGAMLGLIEPGFTCWLSYDAKPTRKLPFTWELVEVPDGSGGFTTVGLNTLKPPARNLPAPYPQA